MDYFAFRLFSLIVLGRRRGIDHRLCRMGRTRRDARVTGLATWTHRSTFSRRFRLPDR